MEKVDLTFEKSVLCVWGGKLQEGGQLTWIMKDYSWACAMSGHQTYMDIQSTWDAF